MKRMNLKLALTGLFLGLLESSGQAQMAPVRAWPSRNFWTAQLFQEPDKTVYCAMHATNYPEHTLDFTLLQFANGGKGVVISETQQTKEIPASKMDFASDGFDVLSLPAISVFSRQLDGSMGNTSAAKPDDQQWETLWKIFRSSGIVTIKSPIATVNARTQGFEQASEDFEECLAQLELIAPAPLAPDARFCWRDGALRECGK